MSLYRQATGPRRAALAAIVLACLLAGLIAGFALGRGTASEPTAAELVAEARAQARPALSALELVTIEYPEGVRGGKVVAQTEYEAAVAQANSASDALAAAEADLGEIDPRDYEAAATLVAEVVSLVEEQAPPGVVDAVAGDATKAVEALVEPASS
jgi:hypothetical protein